jgi:DNA-binding protein YbaB
LDWSVKVSATVMNGYRYQSPSTAGLRAEPAFVTWGCEGGVVAESPQWSALRTMVGDLRQTLSKAEGIQQRMLAVTGTAWSDDRMVKAVVGPRGHLVELEIDPRVFRRPDSKALAASIVATVRVAVDDVMEQTQKIIDESMPADVGVGKVGALDVRKLIGTHDADLRNGGLVAEGSGGDELR